MPRHSVALCVSLLAASAVFALGCASGPAPRDHYYRLAVGRPAALAQPVFGGTLAVDRVRVEAISEGRRLLYRKAAESDEISLHAYSLWVDPPSVMLQDQLVDYLRAAGVAGNVVTPAVNLDSEHEISGRLVRFERVLGDAGSSVVVELELVLKRSSDRELLLLETYREERSSAGPGVAAAVDAYGAAVTAIFERFVAGLPRT